MAKTRVEVLREAAEDLPPSEFTLCLQWCLYHFETGTRQHGYRFIWRFPENEHGKRPLQAARGQARIPSRDRMNALLVQAAGEGWGDLDSETFIPLDPPNPPRRRRSRLPE